MPAVPPANELEQDCRFPSGAWTGFFLQPLRPGKQWMELILTFRQGTLSGEGRDWVGKFLLQGRYQVDDGRCWWTKSYIGLHEVFYDGYNEGKGIWGRWEMESAWKGGFHIWPEGMPDPSTPKKREAIDEPIAEEAPAMVTEQEAVTVGS